MVDCGDPGVLQNGGRNFSSSTKFGSVVTYMCADDFRLTGTQNRTCQSNGRWSGALPVCSPSVCGDPGKLDNGRVEFTDEFKILSMAAYFCSTGYRLRGFRFSVRVCLSGGHWSSRQPSCERKPDFVHAWDKCTCVYAQTIMSMFNGDLVTSIPCSSC